jgi:pectate lyase
MNDIGVFGLRVFQACIILAFAGSGSSAAEETASKAFPAAMGYGQTAVGWRSGQIIHVTNLQDSGPGSLRACVEGSEEPRVCVFDVSGTIYVDREINARPNVYVAGQTARVSRSGLARDKVRRSS